MKGVLRDRYWWIDITWHWPQTDITNEACINTTLFETQWIHDLWQFSFIGSSFVFLFLILISFILPGMKWIGGNIIFSLFYQNNMLDWWYPRFLQHWIIVFTSSTPITLISSFSFLQCNSLLFDFLTWISSCLIIFQKCFFFHCSSHTLTHFLFPSSSIERCHIFIRNTDLS